MTRLTLICGLTLCCLPGCTPDSSEVAPLPEWSLEGDTDPLAAPLPRDLALCQPALRVAGAPVTYSATGANPGETVVFICGSSIAEGPCPPALGDQCLDVANATIFGTAIADIYGEASLTTVLPPGAPVGDEIAMQAVVQRGPGGLGSVASAPVAGLIDREIILPADCGLLDVCDGPDADADGIQDLCDPCPDDPSNDVDGDKLCGAVDPCPDDFANDSDGDGVCDSDDICPDDRFDLCYGEYWVFANYGGIPQTWDPGIQWNGTVDCPSTCGAEGLDAVGARFVCNLHGADPTEGCDESNDGDYGDENCGLYYDQGEAFDNGWDAECTWDSTLEDCITGECTEWMTYHAIQCQCEGACLDDDGDGVCNLADACPGSNDALDADEDGIPNHCDDCPMDADNDADADGLCGEVDFCPFDPDNDADGDGLCAEDDWCPLGNPGIDTDGDGVCDSGDPCPEDAIDSCLIHKEWHFGNYDGLGTTFDSSVRFDGHVNCPSVCDNIGLHSIGARFVCNLAGSSPTEGCDETNDGQYGDANCGLYYDYGVEKTDAGIEDCTSDGLINCVNGTCLENVTYHAIECQCGDKCLDDDGDGSCNVQDYCPAPNDVVVD